ncbi:von Willebrand factor type A domain-containing protein [Flavobacterium sp. SH_e]|uniref:YfbK domain-containing protein n=1 Tax=Flavobacterium sp. SH_e TaxID=2983767 RepID=UPI0021E3A2AB|nr:von Willebrand factor type A domain-containing protein [Flavobacterium sp. SH_e]MCV2483818.1 von Willebrand factor type A domain-containing protein [Flavobacterium sp. SH_e]
MKSLKLISSAIAMLICFVTMAQERTITGTVTDESKTPLPGVQIIIKGTKKYAQTDFDGRYSIQAQKGDALVFSYVGLDTQTFYVQSSNIINVELKSSHAELQEVVVVGYGRSNSEYEDRSYARAERRKEKREASKALQGKVAGIQVSNTIAYVSSPTPTVTIRSTASISPKNEPIYIVDGVKMKANQMSKINPNDIKDLKVLKDDAATSIYGSKASNGVVVISTKDELYKNLTEKELDKKLNIMPIPTEPTQEDYDSFVENAFESPKTAPLSTFSIDVDNASYTNIRRFLNNGQQVPKDAVRVEEMVNFFKYTYPQPKNEHPFSINTEVSDSPWNSKNKILKIGLQGKNIPTEDLPASNLVFLIDVSGSMEDMNKLPLLKQSLKILVDELRPKDKVAIVVYAGAAGLVLPPTSGDEKKTIINALDNLQAGGSTAGGAGIELAYKIAAENFIKSGNNRVILATDGDFNVGSSSNSDMEKLIEEKRKTGVFLTCLGYGMGNYKDSKMEILADKGNGNYAYIDNIQEANRFLGKEFKGSMFAIAKDVKIQIEFNPKQVQSYRLIGYENRKLRPEDFKNDAIDAGELGSNHTVTALYEIIPTGVKSDYLAEQPDDLKYTKTETSSNNYSNELATIKFRYKKPDGEKSIEMVQTIENKSVALEKASDDMKFSSAVAWFGLKLRDSKLIADKSSKEIIKLAKQGNSNDGEGYKAEFIRLVETSKQYN